MRRRRGAARAHHRPEVAALAVGDLGGAVVAKALDDLGRDVLRRADEPGEPLAARRRAAKVDELDDGRALRREDEVLRLEVAVDDVDRVHVVDRERHLREDRQRVVLLEGPLREQVLEQLAAAEALHHDVHVLLVAAHLDHLHDVRVAELLREGASIRSASYTSSSSSSASGSTLIATFDEPLPFDCPRYTVACAPERSSFLRVYRVEMSLSVTSASEVARASGSIASAISSPRLTGARAKFAAASIFAAEQRVAASSTNRSTSSSLL